MPARPRKKTASRTVRAPRPASRRTTAPARAGRTSGLQPRLRKYVDVILDVGLNLQPGQRLLVVNSLTNGVDIGLAPFVRLVAEGAYSRGASLVDVIWGDAQLEVMRLQRAPRESLRHYVKWPAAARLEHAEAADAYLALRGDDPDLLANIDPLLVGDYLAGIREPARPVMSLMFRNISNWCVAGVSAPAWAAKVLPRVPEKQRLTRLWDLILETCRVGSQDPVTSWRRHVGDLAARKQYLNEQQYAALRYTGPDTKLKIGLPPGHIWNGGQMVAENGVTFVPNLPTEEVFTLPHLAQVDGEVTATKPLVYNGSTIEGMHLTFAAGKVVHSSARKGQATLDQLLQTDPGSTRLGEVALVPHSSPLSRMGVTFHSTLFDENAASHLAFGQAYKFSLRGAETASDEDFAALGGNSSKVHSDFMIGSAGLDIDGLRSDGSSEPLMRKGEWAFKV